MNIEVRRVEYQSIEAMRELYRSEAHCQIVCDGDLPRWPFRSLATNVSKTIFEVRVVGDNDVSPRRQLQCSLRLAQRIASILSGLLAFLLGARAFLNCSLSCA
jgi:hypothetical protein